jgi:hypothetical protein
MDAVVLAEGPTKLIFSIPDPDLMMTVPTQYLSVTLEGIDLRATRRVYAGYDEGFAKLARYFNALATDWRGWNGSRYYESIEGDLRIQATHDGHVNLRVLLRESAVPTGWCVEAELRLDAGEALNAAAADIAHLVGARSD